MAFSQHVYTESRLQKFCQKPVKVCDSVLLGAGCKSETNLLFPQFELNPLLVKIFAMR